MIDRDKAKSPVLVVKGLPKDARFSAWAKLNVALGWDALDYEISSVFTFYPHRKQSKDRLVFYNLKKKKVGEADLISRYATLEITNIWIGLGDGQVVIPLGYRKEIDLTKEEIIEVDVSKYFRGEIKVHVSLPVLKKERYYVKVIAYFDEKPPILNPFWHDNFINTVIEDVYFVFNWRQFEEWFAKYYGKPLISQYLREDTEDIEESFTIPYWVKGYTSKLVIEGFCKFKDASLEPVTDKKILEIDGYTDVYHVEFTFGQEIWKPKLYTIKISVKDTRQTSKSRFYSCKWQDYR